MFTVSYTRPALPLAIAALALVVPAAAQAAEEIPFSEARIFFELNNTDADLGLHASIDGEPWKFLAIEDPDAPDLPTVSPPVIITWDAVTRSHPTLGKRGRATVERYQVFAEQRTPNPLKYNLDLPPTMTQYTVAPELIAVGDRQYKFEIQVREAAAEWLAELSRLRSHSHAGGSPETS